MSAPSALRQGRSAVAAVARSWRASGGLAPPFHSFVPPTALTSRALHTSASLQGAFVAEPASILCSAGDEAAASAASSSSKPKPRTGGSFDAVDTRADWNERPQAWDEAPAQRTYTQEDISAWRAEFGFSRRQHSMAQFGYTDDELLEWRKPFDELATEEGISYPKFEQFVCRKYTDVIPNAQLAAKVQYFWEKFDRDRSNFIDFGEFIVVGLAFDIAWAKEVIRKKGIEATFLRYAEDEFMIEPHFFQLMCDFRFFVATATDVRKLVLLADQDRDGLVSLSDFVQWAESADFDMMHGKTKKRRRGIAGDRTRSPPPIPEPE